MDVRVGREQTLTRAKEIASRHGVQLTASSEWLVRTFLSSSRASIPPYHVENVDEGVLSFAKEKGIRLFAEAKYDGTHIQLAANGVFGHSGSAVSPDQLAGLIYVAETQPELMELLRRHVEAGYVIEAELFGSSLTPWGFHRGHRYHFDLVVFEVGRDGKWIPPQERYSMKLPQPTHWEVEPDLQSLAELSKREEVYEGVVVKGEYRPEYGKFFGYLSFVKTDSLLVFKVKGKEVKRRGKESSQTTKPKGPVIDPQVEQAIEGEVLNELAKRGPVEEENFREVLREIVEYLKQAHPLLVEKAGGEKEAMRIVGRVMGMELKKMWADHGKR